MERGNHLLLAYNPKVDKNYFNPEKPLLSKFFKDVGVDFELVTIDKRLVFVLTPFLEDTYTVFRTTVEICNSIGLKCQRGDEQFVRGNIFKYLLEKIISARLIIANIDGRNPNVMYELGIAQAIGKPTILISKNLSDVPFDIKSNNIILYKTDEELKVLLQSTLSKLLVDD